MRRILFLLLQVSILASLKGQVWKPVGGAVTDGAVADLYADTMHHRLYASGEFSYIDSVGLFGAGYWDGSAWHDLAGGGYDSTCAGQSICASLLSIAEHDGSVFATGQILYLDGEWAADKLAYHYNGVKWDTCGNPNQLGWVNKIGEELYLLGYFTEVGGQPVYGFGRWNGVAWEAMADSLISRNWYFFTMDEYQGKLYLGGNFTAGNNYREIVSWDGSNWGALGQGILGDSWVDRVKVYKGLLYVGGDFYAGVGNADDHLMTWNGSEWAPTFPLVQFDSQIYDMEVADGALYIAGWHYVYDNGAWRGPYGLARYDGVNFCSMGEVVQNSVYTDIAVLDGRVYAVNHQLMLGGVRYYLYEYIGGAGDELCVSQPVGAEGGRGEEVFAVLSPNPASGETRLLLEMGRPGDVDVRVLDLRGVVVRRAVYGGVGAGRAELDLGLEGLAGGMYVVEARTGEGVVGLRLVVE